MKYHLYIHGTANALRYYGLMLLVLLATMTGCGRHEESRSIYDEMFRENHRRVMYSGNEYAMCDAQAMLQHAEQHGSRYGKVLAYLSMASLSAVDSKYDEVSRYMEVARASLDVSDPPFLQGYAYFVEGTVDYSTTLSINSLLCYNKALEYFVPLRDSTMVASCYINKFNYYAASGNLENAAACIDSARHWCSHEYRYTVQLYEALLHNYRGEPSLTEFAAIAAEGATDSIARPSRPTARFWAMFYTNYILASLSQEGVEAARKLHGEMVSMVDSCGNLFDRTCCRLTEGWIYAEKGDYDSAMAVCTDILTNYHGEHKKTIQREVLDLMVGCSKEMGNWQRALEYTEQRASLAPRMATDSRFLAELIDRQYDYERKIDALKIKSAQIRNILLATALMLVLLAVTLFYYRQRRVLNDRQQRIRELEQEQRLREQQKEIDTAVMEHATTREQMDSFAGDVRRIASEMPKNVRSRLLQSISRIEQHREQDAWSDFEESFERQHAGFLAMLTERYPSLLPLEVKICMLIRAGLTNREIADTLHLADNTVRTYRTRIRKKMGIDKADVDTNTFIATLGA